MDSRTSMMLLGREPRVQPPALDAYSDLPLYNTKAVVHSTGVPAPTLRAWERRYGILSPRRGENDYRLYSERDMMMVSWLRERVETGMTISQAIALLRSMEPARRRKGRTRTGATGQALSGGGMTLSPLAVPERLALADLEQTLLRQFAALDEPGAIRTITQALAVYAVEDVCLILLAPVLEDIGRRWAAGELMVTVEHFATGVIRAQLEGLFRSTPGGEGGPLALVGCAPGELHELGPLMLALFLRRAGVHVVFLGQNVEPEHLIVTIDALHPACVVLSVSTTDGGEVARLGNLGTRVNTVGTRAPLFCFGGRAFTETPELACEVPGVYLAGDARAAASEIKRRMAG